MPWTRPRPSALLTVPYRSGHQRILISGKRHAEIVGLHDKCDHAIDRDGDPDANDRQDKRLGPDVARRNGGRREEVAEPHRGGQQDQQLVAKRPRRDLGDDRQFALGGKPDHVARCHGGVVDHHAGRLGAGLGGLACDVVKRRRGHVGNGRNIVEQGNQSDAHGIVLL
jgi:hypothetical protein